MAERKRMECRNFGNCLWIGEYGCYCDGHLPEFDGKRTDCREYEPMPDVDALLRIAQVLESADKSECMGCVLEDSGCHLCVIGVEHEIAERIREAVGR